MDEVYKTVRTIYLALLTLCFVSSVFLASIRSNKSYADIAPALKELLNAKVYRFPPLIPELASIVNRAKDTSRAEQILKIKKALTDVDFALPNDIIDKIELPSDMPAVQVITEVSTLLVNRRSVALNIDRHARLFQFSGIDVNDENVPQNKELAPACGADFNVPADLINEANERVGLVVNYGRNSKNQCSGDKGRIRLPVSGSFVDVAGTSFREWLTSIKLFKPPLFVEDASGEVIFLKINEDVWSEILNKRPADAYEYLVSQSMRSPTKIKIFDVEIEASLLSWIVPALMLIVLVALYLHIDNARQAALRRKDQAPSWVPWVGSFQGNVAKSFYFASIVIWPLAIGMGFLIQLYTPTLLFVVTALLWFGAVASGVAAFLASQRLRRVDPR